MSGCRKGCNLRTKKNGLQKDRGSGGPIKGQQGTASEGKGPKVRGGPRVAGKVLQGNTARKFGGLEPQEKTGNDHVTPCSSKVAGGPTPFSRKTLCEKPVKRSSQ